MNLINPPWTLVNVVNVLIEINLIPAGRQEISPFMHINRLNLGSSMWHP